MREVDLGLDFFFAVSGARGRLRRALGSVGAATKMFSHQFGFVIFERTGVGLFLRDAHRGEHVKNFLALDLQLTGQIVNSNLTHPLSLPVSMPPIPHF